MSTQHQLNKGRSEITWEALIVNLALARCQPDVGPKFARCQFDITKQHWLLVHLWPYVNPVLDQYWPNIGQMLIWDYPSSIDCWPLLAWCPSNTTLVALIDRPPLAQYRSTICKCLYNVGPMSDCTVYLLSCNRLLHPHLHKCMPDLI